MIALNLLKNNLNFSNLKSTIVQGVNVEVCKDLDCNCTDECSIETYCEG